MSGYLTTNEAARVFDVSLRTVQLWFDSGVLPGGRTMIWTLRDLIDSEKSRIRPARNTRGTR